MRKETRTMKDLTTLSLQELVAAQSGKRGEELDAIQNEIYRRNRGRDRAIKILKSIDPTRDWKRLSTKQLLEELRDARDSVGACQEEEELFGAKE
jgi:hypothetical protein